MVILLVSLLGFVHRRRDVSFFGRSLLQPPLGTPTTTAEDEYDQDPLTAADLPTVEDLPSELVPADIALYPTPAETVDMAIPTQVDSCTRSLTERHPITGQPREQYGYTNKRHARLGRCTYLIDFIYLDITFEFAA